VANAEHRASARRAGAHGGDVHRLFVALWPSPAAVADLADLLDRGRPGGPDLHWQPPHRWHITVAFLGQAPLDRTRRALDRVVLPPAAPLHLQGCGTFGPVLWIGVEHGPWLGSLADRVRTALHADEGPFRPHLTVARGRGRAAIPRARQAAAALAQHRGPDWLPQELTLVRSLVGPQPEYQVLATWPLPSTST